MAHLSGSRGLEFGFGEELKRMNSAGAFVGFTDFTTFREVPAAGTVSTVEAASSKAIPSLQLPVSFPSDSRERDSFRGSPQSVSILKKSYFLENALRNLQNYPSALRQYFFYFHLVAPMSA